MTLEVGDRVAVYGGQFGVAWLNGRPHLAGAVLKWNPGRYNEPACVVELDEEFSTTGELAGQRTSVSGTYLVLHLRRKRQKWDETGIVQVELFDHEPDTRPWEERPKGAWVETHAVYADITAGEGDFLPPNEIPFYLRTNNP